MRLPKTKYIAAVSGGPDSMALLDKYKHLIVGVCHVNYHKRVDSDFDTAIVKKYCKQHKIPLAVHNVNKTTYSKAKEHNFQTLARNIRYSFFVKCAKKFKCNNLLIAHNLNDFIETAIMQENRHSLNFFYGIKPISQYKTIKIYRPLIKEFKKDLEEYCLENQINYAIDSSNASDIYERNRIRKQINAWSKSKILNKYDAINNRNKKFAKQEALANKYLKAWQNNKFCVNFAKTIPDSAFDNVIYLYLKNNNITNVNYNKIKLVRDYIVSKKSNNCLRLEQNIHLSKKDKKIKVVQK